MFFICIDYVDGVAPRAKMNQQRSRRFRAAKEGKELAAMEAEVRNKLISEGKFSADELPEKKERWDHNQITPGTKFMDRVAKALRHYNADRITNDPAWRNLAVIVSDSNIPGEGEHKLMV